MKLRRELILEARASGDHLPFSADLLRLTQLTRLGLTGAWNDHMFHYRDPRPLRRLPEVP